ncbi:FAD-dependent oxidoreductase [Rasiella rasia]|uniref:FAD-dependent oxidoreductase n=1 Tax=Rasiella rasia TaxID=2744027 RepID=A0A6G6GLD2_9FLAO|nr:FAD-dependent oxidoreductase [Rasiella rasia]QIE59358.1 FAD-dependent oxidoreductase [Rasiella rasia]
MKKVDYILVGFGIAGVTLAESLLQRGKTFVVYDDAAKGATTASGGVLNPTVLKRFTAAWNASEFFETAIPFYSQLSDRLNASLINTTTIHRIFNSIEEQNNWMVASDKKELSQYLASEITSNQNPAINAPFGLGAVKEGAMLQPKELIEKFRAYLKDRELLRIGQLDFNALQVTSNDIRYQDISAANIIFSQGASVVNNPFFKLSVSPKDDRVFVGNKGEYVLFKAPALQLNEVLKGPVMIIPLDDHLYKVGASYSRDDFSEETTIRAKEEILQKLKKMISCNFEVVGQVAGVRPTVIDRKPLLGGFDDTLPVYFMNGLGTRGLSMAPLLSTWLLDFIEKKTVLPKEVDVKRFY